MSETWEQKRKRMAKEAAKKLIGAFDWHATLEGQEYWIKVHANLERIAKEGF